jgi:hypothetical protein
MSGHRTFQKPKDYTLPRGWNRTECPMKWPWPRDSREDRAKRVALSYRHLVQSIARGERNDVAEALAALDDRWCQLGAGWVRPTLAPLRLDDWLTGAEMAELFSQEARTIRDWGRRGNIRCQTMGGVRRYNVGDVVAYQRDRRLRRPVDACATVSAGQPAP